MSLPGITIYIYIYVCMINYLTFTCLTLTLFISPLTHLLHPKHALNPCTYHDQYPVEPAITMFVLFCTHYL